MRGIKQANQEESNLTPRIYIPRKSMSYPKMDTPRADELGSGLVVIFHSTQIVL